MALEFYKKLKNESMQIYKEDNHIILFVLYGKILCKSPMLNDFFLTPEQTMFIPICMDYTIFSIEESNIMLLSLSEMPDTHTAEFISSLKRYIPDDCVKLRPPYVMNMKRKFDEMFCYLKYISESKWKDNLYMQALLLKGILLVYEEEHSYKENALFFQPLITTKHYFRNQVMANHYKAKNVKDLAKICSMPYHTFCRQFVSEFHSSPYQWMLDQRKKRIKSLLEATDITISEIAEQLHFCSIAHLSKFCTKYFGQSPSSIRKESQKHRMQNL